MLKQESVRREAWYDLLVPYVHYVPVAADLADLEAQMAWALSNASRLHRIASNGARLAMRHLSRRGQLCHWLALLRELGRHTGRVAVAPSAARTALGPSAWRGRTAHVPLLGPLRPQLTHISPQLGDLLGLLRLHPTPCLAGLTQAHLCVDL